MVKDTSRVSSPPTIRRTALAVGVFVAAGGMALLLGSALMFPVFVAVGVVTALGERTCWKQAAAVLLGFGSFAPAARAQTVALPAHRSTVIATAIAVNVPGGGHYYAGERGKAIAIASVTTGGFLLFLSGWGSDDCHRPLCNPGGARLRERVGARIVVGAYVFSLVDAPLAVRRQNRSRAVGSRVTAAIMLSSEAAPGLGVHIPVGRGR